MTIEERLDSLAARQEMLGMSFELLKREVEAIAAAQRANEALFERNERRLADVMDAINTLGRIAGLQQERMDNEGSGQGT